MRFFLLLLTLRLGAQEFAVPCEPTPETIRLLESAPPLRDTAIPFEQRVGALRALAETHPGDFFIQQAYQNSIRDHRTLGDEYDRAVVLYRGRPNDPLSAYYQARLEMFSSPARSQATFDALFRDHPEFVWPHLDQVMWMMIPGKRSDPELQQHMQAFGKGCPEAFHVTGVRAALVRRNTPLELMLWPDAWNNEGAAAEGRIRGDLKRIEAWPFRADPELFYVYQQAARILKDPTVLRTLRTKVEHDAPNSLLALAFVKDDWQTANPVPDRNAPPAAWKERQEKESQAQREWLRRWPNAWELYGGQLMQLHSQVDSQAASLTASDLEFLDNALRVHAMSPDAGDYWPPVATSVARIYAAAKTRLDRVPALLDAGLRDVEKMNKYQPSLDLFPAELRSQWRDWRAVTAAVTEEARVDYLTAVNRPADARALIEQALQKMDAAKSDAPESEMARQNWMRRLANADAQEGRVEDALAHYQASLPRADRQVLADPRMQPFIAVQKKYYLAHGGTEEKFVDWATVESKTWKHDAAPPALSFPAILPEFSASDLAGRIWRVGDLKGKATFVNYWATWCGPCRGEHPALQELYDRIKDRRDIQLLTISIDEDDAAARQYMKEKGYTFPVIRNPGLADKLFPYSGVPDNFLVNPRAMRSDMYPIGADSASVTRLIGELTRIAGKQP